MTTPLARPLAGYDREHKRALVDAISRANGAASLTDDNGRPLVAIRTAEIAAASTTVLASVLAMSPAAPRSPAAIRRFCEELRNRLGRQVAVATADPEVRNFVDRRFRFIDDTRGGRPQ
jgi:hypothetical protein